MGWVIALVVLVVRVIAVVVLVGGEVALVELVGAVFDGNRLRRSQMGHYQAGEEIAFPASGILNRFHPNPLLSAAAPETLRTAARSRSCGPSAQAPLRSPEGS